MVKKTSLLGVFLFLIATVGVLAQCNTLSTNRSIDFKTDQACAPVNVTQFELTYNFATPQDPASIEIVYEWNDPGNTIDVVNIGNGLMVDGTGKAFTADRTMLYASNNGQCAIQPTAYIRINGVTCPSSTQTQTAFFWENDDTGNGNLALTPTQWDVCRGDAVVNATFRDDTEFNCNINVEPDNPNQGERHVQFVYGTHHNPAFTIRNLGLNDGSAVALTDNNGDLVGPETRGTAGLPVSGAYFGPVETVPFPANGPISVSFPMSAPADPANAVGNRFEVTMFNWNTCNPWNGDPVNPNYEDALQIPGFVEIVDGPMPDFITKDANGNQTSDFCIGDPIFFSNTTVNGDNFTWEFYDDATGTTLLQTSSQKNPTFQFMSGGPKLIRLIARNSTAQSACEEETTGIVNITPSLTAKIAVSDLNGDAITPDFCQETSAPLSTFDVRFSDASTGTPTPTTVRRWEFYDENNSLVFEEPTGGVFSSTALGPFDRAFTNRGIYRARLRVRDNTTGCESSDEVHVRVFEKPQPAFSSSRVCETTATSFADLSSLHPVAGEQIVSWEWDMDYDGTTFTKDGTLDNKRTFDYTFPAAGSHEVALRVTTDGLACSSLLQQTVQVDAVPLAAFTADQTSGCSTLAVELTNNSASGQPDVIKEFVWEVDDGSGFETDSTQRPGDPGFSDTYVRNFVNTGTVNRDYQVRLRVVTVNNCDAVSAPVTLTVFPQPRSGFVSLNYSPFNDNCTPVSVNFAVDDETKSLNPTDYLWIINDAAGPVDQISTGTTPSFQYSFNNTSQLVKDFFVTLRATLPSACYGDSTRTIRISPVPSSDFAVDTVSYACDRIVLGMDASQKGLSKYTWTISINSVVVFSSTTDGEHLEYEVTRSTSVDQHVAIDLQTQNLTNCESTVTSRNVLVTRADDFDASFTATPQQQTLPESTVTITNATNVGPWQYLWDFGDGTTSTDPAVSAHTYTTFGLYTISLTVNNDDCTETVSADVRINPIPPVLDFDYFPASGCAPHTVTFINKSRYADPASYVWKFGAQEGTSRAVDPTYTYARDGVYSVTLSATNELGDTVTITREAIIQVLPNPVAQFAVYPTTPVNVPGEVVYTDNRSRDASEYRWDFGDGYTSTEVEPQHKYTKEGTYDITLVATNGNGCADTTVSVSAVRAVNHGQLLIPNAFIPNKTGPGSANPLNNEVFLPIVQKVTKFQMLIFNRWGQLVFESSSPEVGWDGYFKGRLCAQDVYIYRVTAEYENGRTITRTGDVNLIR
jgi:gliding motility-associated-like protein